MIKDVIIEATRFIVEKIEPLKGEPLEDIIKVAMEEALALDMKITPLRRGRQQQPRSINDNERFRAAVTAIAHIVDEKTRERIKEELQVLGASAGVKSKRVRPSDKRIKGLPEIEKPIDLLAYWKELKNAK